MVIRQYYYTSYVHAATGKAGFQIKAMSAGISAEQQATLARLIAYRIPPDCDIDDCETHPIALRYACVGPGQSLLLCSRSCGRDEHGRPGNFFAHALLLKEELFSSIPPILFWKSSFWRAQDPGERAEPAELPMLSSDEMEPALEREEIWHFLAQGNRYDWLYKLLCAIIHSSSTRRRIVILDSAEHVALWIAAVSLLLPPAYSPLLTFATYHHDPYQAEYLLTGTTGASFFRASADDYLAYFVLNAYEGLISAVDASPYARLAVQVARSGLYEQMLLPLFADQPTLIDEQLDLFVLSKAIFERFPPPEVPDLSGTSVIKLARQVVEALSGEEYRAVIERCIGAFMRMEASPTLSVAHLQLIQALFPLCLRLQVSEFFWQVYLEAWQTMLQEPALFPQALAILDFWFTSAPGKLPEGYPAQRFWLLLSKLLRRERKLWQTLVVAASEQPWYGSLQTIFPPQEDVLTTLGRQVMRGWSNISRKWLPEKGEWEEAMEQLFVGDDVAVKQRGCLRLYLSVTPERFWVQYWRHFKHLLVSHDIERVFAILSFWFDDWPEADLVASEKPVYLAQEFFLGWGGMLEQAMQVRSVREIAPQLRFHEMVWR